MRKKKKYQELTGGPTVHGRAWSQLASTSVERRLVVLLVFLAG